MSSTFRFDPGSTRLDVQSRSNVMQLAQAIRDGRFGGRELMLVGFSDGRGPATANRDLSSARAEAVRRDLIRALGGNFPANVAIDTAAFGEALPMACDDTIWGQQTNRRVELWVRDAS
jgi:phosphate transport system substrate-binding protein